MKLQIRNSRWVMALASSVLLVAKALSEPPAEPTNGQLYYADSDSPLAWSSNSNQWLALDDFWKEYAEASSGKYWGERGDYPRYADVNEHDTVLITGEEGSCLMYFFHTRWRRAQDVRRWDPAQNDALGCPFVFK